MRHEKPLAQLVPTAARLLTLETVPLERRDPRYVRQRISPHVRPGLEVAKACVSKRRPGCSSGGNDCRCCWCRGASRCFHDGSRRHPFARGVCGGLPLHRRRARCRLGGVLLAILDRRSRRNRSRRSVRDQRSRFAHRAGAALDEALKERGHTRPASARCPEPSSLTRSRTYWRRARVDRLSISLSGQWWYRLRT